MENSSREAHNKIQRDCFNSADVVANFKVPVPEDIEKVLSVFRFVASLSGRRQKKSAWIVDSRWAQELHH